jgi:type I restriction enzyme S subunit
MRTLKLGDVCTKIGSGATPRGGSDVYLAEGVPLIRSQNVYNDGFHFDGLAFIGEKHANELLGVTVEPGDVLLNITGDSVARSCRAPAEITPARVNQHVAIIRPDESVLDSRYLHYYLVSPEKQASMLSLASGGATRNALTKGMIENFEVPAPPIEVQEAIAEFLGSLDDKIEQNRRTGSKLEGLARTVFKAWFVDFEPVKAKAAGATAFPGMPPETFATLPTRFTNSELGQLPQGWTDTDLGSEFELQVGYAFKSAQFTDNTEATRLVRGDNVKEGWIEWGSKTRRWEALNDKIRGYSLSAGDVVIGMDGSKLGRNWARIREFDLPALLVQRVARFRANRLAGPSLLWLLISHPSFREFIDAVKTGTSIPHISGGQLRDFKFVKPGTESGQVWSTFEDAVAPLLKMADHLAGESKKLAELRDYLLPRLLCGRVKVGVTNG